MAELQTKLANLILGLKTQPELDQLVHDAQDLARPPVADSWAPPAGESWGSTTSPSRAGGAGSGSGSGGWGSPSRAGATGGWGSPSRAGATGGWGSPSRGDYGNSTQGAAAGSSWGVSPNANGTDADTTGWGGGGATSSGWQSPTPKTNTGWNR